MSCKTNRVKVKPLKEMGKESCPFYRSEEGFARDSLLRQCARRPEVWDVGLWPDVGSENVAKIIAHLFEVEDENLRAAFVPNDPFNVLFDFNLTFGKFELLPTVFRMFDCRIEEDEFAAQPNMTFGEFVSQIVARKRKMPEVPQMRACGDRRLGRDPVELVVLMGALSILCSWIVKYIWYAHGYPYVSVVIVLIWALLVGGLFFRHGWRHARSNFGQYVSPVVGLILFYLMFTSRLFHMLGGG